MEPRRRGILLIGEKLVEFRLLAGRQPRHEHDVIEPSGGSNGAAVIRRLRKPMHAPREDPHASGVYRPRNPVRGSGCKQRREDNESE
jgi:hypothetical protein